MVLTAHEHQALGIGAGPADLSAAEAATLLALSVDRPGLCSAGLRSVRLAQYVGLVNLGSRTLEILPKLGESTDADNTRNVFLRLLHLAHDLPIHSAISVDHGVAGAKLLDVFVMAYLRSLMQLVHRGLVRRYAEREEDLPVIRGSVLWRRQAVVNMLRVDRVSCRFDELSADNPWNQVLRTALLKVRPWLRSTQSERHWLELMAAFDGIAALRNPLQVHATLPMDRQVAHYAVALRWAGWILQLLSPDLRSGHGRAPALLFDMNRLFEAAVTRVMAQRARACGWMLRSQETSMRLAGLATDPSRRFFNLRPDIVLRDGAEAIMVADTKWARLEYDRQGYLLPNDAHVYQLNAYAAAYAVEEVVLIYPHHAGLDGYLASAFDLPEVQGSRPRLHVVCMDVGTDALDFGALCQNSRMAALTNASSQPSTRIA